MSAMPEAGLLEMLRRWAEAGPHAPALLAPGRAALGRRGLEQHVREGLGALACFGVGRGDRVALVLPDGPEMAAAFLTVAAGAASAPLNPALTPRELEAAFEELGPRAVVVPSGEGVEVAAIARGHGIAVVELMADPAAPRRIRVRATTWRWCSRPRAPLRGRSACRSATATCSRPRSTSRARCGWVPRTAASA
jgi:acyl-CoA synthetase (AMP-forming)/AMP-acid ligase II